MPAGRPETINRDTIATICKAIEGGAFIETAAALAGVSKRTVFGWLARGRREEGQGTLYEEFLHAVEFSRAKAEAALISTIVDAARYGKSWKAAAYLLERQYGARWARDGQDARGAEDQLDSDPIAAMTPEERRANIDELLAKRATLACG